MAVLTEEQLMLQDMATGWVRDRVPVTAYRTLFEGEHPTGHNPAHYHEMAEMGWTGIVVPEAHGGVDFGYLSLGLIIEQLGRTLVASPLVSSALGAASALRLGGDEAQQARWMPGIADGSSIGVLAIDEGARHAPLSTSLKAVRKGDGWQIDGIKRPVQDGMAADFAIVAARTSGAPGDSEGITLFVVDVATKGVSRHALDQIDARSPAVFTFDGVDVADDAVLGDVNGGAPLLDAILDRVRIGIAAEMLGAASQAFETTVDYLKTRVQFGKLIGSFQALQHRAAAMFAELQLARSAVEGGLAAIDDDAADIASRASLAKAIAGDTIRRVSSEMIQMHGGIGMTHEHDAGLYLKRARVIEQLYGNGAYHRDRWGRLNGF